MTLKIPVQTIHGRVFTLKNDQTAVVFHPHNARKHPPPALFTPLYLRYALTIRGSERPFLPSLVLDDWGQEISKLKLYRWLHLEGDRFPRAEIFGYIFNFNEQWEENQFFSRDLELSARHATYLYTDKTEPAAQGQIVHHLLLTSDNATQLQPAKTKGKQFKIPLAQARVTWWHIPTELALQPEPDLSQLVS